MAYRRTLTTRATLLARRRFTPSFPYVRHDDDHQHPQDPNFNAVHQHRHFGNGASSLLGFAKSMQNRRCSQFYHSPMSGVFFSGRNMSTMVEGGADKIEYMSDVAEVLADKTVEAVASAAPVVSEVAVAAADSAFPVAASQYFIDNVHTVSGFNCF